MYNYNNYKFNILIYLHHHYDDISLQTFQTHWKDDNICLLPFFVSPVLSDPFFVFKTFIFYFFKLKEDSKLAGSNKLS